MLLSRNELAQQILIAFCSRDPLPKDTAGADFLAAEAFTVAAAFDRQYELRIKEESRAKQNP
jgi:hypothetical protein